jgi:hypothetical protein
VGLAKAPAFGNGVMEWWSNGVLVQSDILRTQSSNTPLLQHPIPRCQPPYSSTRFRRRAFAITLTELKLIAAPAMIGLSSQPNAG